MLAEMNPGWCRIVFSVASFKRSRSSCCRSGSTMKVLISVTYRFDSSTSTAMAHPFYRRAAHTEALTSDRFDAHLQPVELLFEAMKRVIPDLVPGPHVEGDPPRGDESGPMDLVMAGARGPGEFRTGARALDALEM